MVEVLCVVELEWGDLQAIRIVDKHFGHVDLLFNC